MENKSFYRRKLPHLEPRGGTFFITILLKDALPKKRYEELKYRFEEKLNAIPPENKKEKANLRKKHLAKIHELLRKSKSAHHFKNAQIAQILKDALFYWDQIKLEMIAFCIMSNHAHVVMRLFIKAENEKIYLNKIMHSIKRHSGNKANKILKKSGQFWRHESFDYLVRNENELSRIIAYVLDNPVKAGLCENRKDWKWSYIKEEYNEFM